VSGLLPFAAFAGRAVGVSWCLVVYAVMLTLFFAGLVGLAWRDGPPRLWPRRAVVGVVAGAVVISGVWWWIDAPVEGRILFTVSSTHGLTVGDLLVAPVLAAAALVVLAARTPARAKPLE
jgi:hypothetical protein